MLFGCDPASGVAANTKLVMVIVQHLMDYFHPDDGSALLPECFGVVDALKNEVALEQTSCNLGKSLKLRRQDNRVGTKMIVVVIKNPRQPEINALENKAIKDDDSKNPEDEPQKKTDKEEDEEDKKMTVTNLENETVEYRYSDLKKLALKRTTKVIDFFKQQMHFTDEEIVYFTEDEARTLVDLLD